MTENDVEGTQTKGFEVEEIYNHWIKCYGSDSQDARIFAVDQTLHPAMLRDFFWEDGVTPREIAKFALEGARDAALRWVKNRKDFYFVEQGEHYERVHQVRREIRKILRREKSNFGG